MGSVWTILPALTAKAILDTRGCLWVIWVVWMSVCTELSAVSGSFVLERALYSALSASAAGNILVAVRRLLLRKMLFAAPPTIAVV